jgi:prophage tail gpP-like protein
VSNFLGDLASKINGGKTAPLGTDTLKLLVNGKSFEGWQQITVKRSLKAIAGAFSLSVVDKWAEDQVAWQIAPEDVCKVQIGSDTIITGYVDGVDPQFDADSRSLSISGRDKTGDLVDSSIDQTPSTWVNISLMGLVKKIATPFGVGVRMVGVTAAQLAPNFPSWKINQGESCFETLERAARLRGVLLINDGKGNIVITRAGTDRASTELVQGSNILSASASFNAKERFSKYTVKAQSNGLDGVESDPEVNFSCQGLAHDAGVRRYRPIVIIAEGAATAAVCRTRAQWEAAVRIGKSTQVKVKVPGWRQTDGALWNVNQLAKVNAPWLGLNLELLITEVSFSKSDSGTTTELSLEPAQAYKPDPTYIARKDPWRQLVVQESRR